jgi:TonB-dependent SusC/RagA subfamily outer membrane receptor
MPLSAFAQFSVTGKILNRNDDQPVANVSVFLSNSTFGTSTNSDGNFNLANVKPGKYDLICSKIGFAVYSTPIVVNNTDVVLPNIQLSPQAIALQEVKIKAVYDPAREQNLDMFQKEFLGTSDMAKQCKMINPEVLDLKYDDKTKTLTAKSGDFLVIENKALGYHIKYLLSNFELNEYDPAAKRFYYEGSVLFEEMKGDSVQELRWEEKRREVYANTSIHFLRAALRNNLSNEGFTVFRLLLSPERPADSTISSKIRIFTMLSDKRQYRDSLAFWSKKTKLPKFIPRQVPSLVKGQDIVKKTTKPGEYALVADNSSLYVVYGKSRQPKARSLSHLLDRNDAATLVSFNAPMALFDARGSIINTGSLTYEGKWARLRLAELLPMDYGPEQNAAPVDSVLFNLINNKIEAYSATHKIEKAYLHFDKPYYAAGDTIYFKGYVTNARHQPSDINRILTIEVIKPSGDILATLKLQLTDGMSAGDFAIPDSLNGGTYRIRAYTNIMQSAGEEFLFDQNLRIVNASDKPASNKVLHNKSNKGDVSATQTKASGKIDVQFFPEGGNLVDGVSSKIAFKAIAPNGLGIGIHGVITDESGNKVAAFNSQHLGMGVITFKPVANKKYTSNITYNGGMAAFDLPKAVDAGYALAMDNSDPDYLKVNINSGQQNHENVATLVGQCRGTVCFYTTGKLVNHSFSTMISKDVLPEGIVQFTLFSSNGEPMNERLVFVRHRGEFSLKLSTDKSVYHARDKVRANLLVTDNNAPASGSFSVAVTNLDQVPVNENNESSILSNLLLTSDIKGYVEQPGYYFNDKNEKAASDLDVLMQTQGYRRFAWRQILNDKSVPESYQPEKLSIVSGTINTAGGKPIPHARISMTSISKGFFNLDTIADEHGKFTFEHFPIIDSMRYIIQASDKEARKKSFIAIDQHKYQKINEPTIASDSAAKENAQMLAFTNFSNTFHQQQIKQGIGSHGIALKGITVKAKAEKKYLKNSENLNGPGNANDVVTADQLPPAAPTFKDAIIGHLHGIQYVNGNFYYGMFPSLVILDGIEIHGNLNIVMGNFKFTSGPSHADIMNSIPISQIASVEIITDASLAAIYGVRGAGGVIIVTTKRWNDVKPDGSVRTNFAYFSPVDFYKARTFYSPKYDSPKTNAQFPDLRTTIYWNPFVNTDETGKARFEFFNADTKGTYRVVIEGMDNEGHLGREAYNYKVE